MTLILKHSTVVYIIDLSRRHNAEVVVAVLADIEARLVRHHTTILHRDAVVTPVRREVVAEAGPGRPPP